MRGRGVMGRREGGGMVIGRVGTLRPDLDGVRGKGSGPRVTPFHNKPVLVNAARGLSADSRLWRDPWVSLCRSTGPLSSKGSMLMATSQILKFW